MTDEEIAERRQHVNRTQTVFGMEWRQTFCYTSGEYADLLSEVERLRALAHDEHVIGQAFVDRINELEQQNAAMREIVAAVATKDVLSHEGDAGDWISCPFCGGEDDWRNPEHPIDQHFIHEPTCVVMKARSLLKTEADDGAS